MRGVFLGAVVIGLLAGGVVVGVRALTGGSSSPQPAEAVQSGTPQATANAFATAWTAGNTHALYDLLDAGSQRSYPYSTFSAAYDAFETETTETGVEAHALSAIEGSATLAVRVSTAYFGVIEYTTTLNLVHDPDEWRVAWLPSAIHPDLTEGRTFKSDIQRPTRGTILDRNGAPLAVTQDVRYIGLNRSIIKDRATVTAALVTFGFTREQVDKAFDDPSPLNQRIRVGVVSDAKESAAADLTDSYSGLLLFFESQRVHPLGAAAAHVVGYTRELTAEELAKRAGEGYRIGDRVGATGLEATEEATLAGKVGATLTLVAADGVTTVKTYSSTQYVAAKDVKTTLDSATLRAAAARLADRPGAAVVIDPRTNEILAINSSPSFDPDAFERNDAAALAAIIAAPDSPQANRATMGLYSAGSTFKLITGAAGLVYGGYKTTDRLECGSIWYGLDPPRHNWEGAQGELTIAEGLMRSCNPVFYQIGLTLYNTTDGALSKMARLFGFGKSTGTVGLADEDGLVPDAELEGDDAASALVRRRRGEPRHRTGGFADHAPPVGECLQQLLRQRPAHAGAHRRSARDRPRRTPDRAGPGRAPQVGTEARYQRDGHGRQRLRARRLYRLPGQVRHGRGCGRTAARPLRGGRALLHSHGRLRGRPRPGRIRIHRSRPDRPGHRPRRAQVAFSIPA